MALPFLHSGADISVAFKVGVTAALQNQKVPAANEQASGVWCFYAGRAKSL